jgi:hypothetical protein
MEEMTYLVFEHVVGSLERRTIPLTRNDQPRLASFEFAIGIRFTHLEPSQRAQINAFIEQTLEAA